MSWPNRHVAPMRSDGRQMNPGPGNIWWCPEPAYQVAEFGPPLPTIGAVVRLLHARADAIDDSQHAAEAAALDYAAEHLEALEDQYAKRMAPGAAALEALTELVAEVTVDNGPKARAIIDAFESMIWGLGFTDHQYGAVMANAFPDDGWLERPPSLDRQGVRAVYGARLADRLTEWLDTLDPSDAETVTVAIHRDISDREEA